MTPRPDLNSIWQSMGNNPGGDFMRSPLGSFRYGRLSELAGRFCAAFDQSGLLQGDRVLIVTVNEPAAGTAFLAALLDGLIPVMLSPDSKPERFNAICDSVKPGLLIADSELISSLVVSDPDATRAIEIPPASRFGLQRRGPLAALWRAIGHSSLNADDLGHCLPASGREPRLPAADDTTAYILFTSGTTTAPSGVQISRNSLMAHLETLTRLFSYGAESRIFNATPLAHTDGLVQGLLLAAANGATLLRPGSFSLPKLEEWLDSLGRFEATHFITNPTVLGLIDRFAAHDDYFDDDRFIGILSSASILRPSLWEKIESRFGCSVFNMYGMTETVANATYAGRHPKMGPVGTIGVPVDCEVRLVEVDNAEVESSVRGELQIRGENVFQGYWKNPEKTTHTLIDDGWMRTGDLARIGENGGFEIIGRVNTIINMGGQSIMPEEIDETLAAHPAVMDVATVGLPDPDFQEVAVSAVVLETPASEAELTEHCRRHLEHLKVPKRILSVEKIPRGDAGKSKTGLLRELLSRLLEVGSGDASTCRANAVSTHEVYRMAAEVFLVPAEELNSASSPATVEAWDSFNQLSLMIEAEARFGIRISASKVASIRTLGDLHQTIIANQ